MTRRPAGSIAGLLLAAALVAGCSAPEAASGSASPAPGSPAPSVVVTSPVEGLIVRLDAEGLTKVTGFRLRTSDGTELELRIGILENGVEFPPGHLAEHMATTSAIRAFFREEAGARVVYRLEDAE